VKPPRLLLALGSLAALLAAPEPLRALSAGADFLTMQAPARPAGMGGAFVGFTDDASAFQWDPASLGALDQPRLGATHFSGLIDTSNDAVAFAQPMKVWGAATGLGLGMQYDSTSNFDQVDASGNVGGSVQNYDLLLQLAGGLALTRTLRLGVGGKFFTSRLADARARGAAVDIGAQVDLHPRVTLGACLQNLGTQEAYDQVADPLPALLRLGGRVLVVDSPEVRILGAFELDQPWGNSAPSVLGVGGEYWYRSIMVLRAGWRLGEEQGPLSLGLGLVWHGMTLDYAYRSMGDLGLVHRFSLGAELGTLFRRLGLTVEPIEGQRAAAPSGPTHVDAPLLGR
jgi:hypothetical protein